MKSRFRRRDIDIQKAITLIERVAFFKPRTRGWNRELSIWNEAIGLAVTMDSTMAVTEAEKEAALRMEAWQTTRKVVQQIENASFPRFNSLPLELKNEIWGTIVIENTSVARLKLFWGLPPRLLPCSRIPAVFQVNQ